jgi:glycosyltransferase involved in cell wall biosynthesis
MPKEKPTVSIIIPTYNRAQLIGRSIHSVLNQTYQDFEIIVVDDGSTDNTAEVIKKFQEKEKRIRYIKQARNKGAAAARNTGIKNAKGEFIAFQDSDDEWLPGKLEKQMNVFENASPEVGIVYTGFWRIENDKKTYIPFSWVKQKEGNIHKELLKGNFVTTQSIVVRKKCFEKAGMFDENLPRLQDWELVIRLSKYYDFKCIDKPLMISYYTSNSISSNQDALIIAQKLILKKYFGDIKKNKKVLANHYLGIGINLCANREIEEGESYFIKAFKTYPNIKKDKKMLSRHYFSIGVSLCSNGDLREGKNYLVKAVKANPLNTKFSLGVFLSFFGQSVFNRAITGYRKVKNIKVWEKK